MDKRPVRHGDRGGAQQGVTEAVVTVMALGLALQSPAESAADLGSVLVFVFERELKLGPVGDRATLVQ
ncbi:MAG TPA: hypothetical protein VGP67_12420, partial [Gaiellales bacterium]|nr:hypothetical protein [Gaiellales bacterium]